MLISSLLWHIQQGECGTVRFIYLFVYCLFIISVPGKCSTAKLALFVRGCAISLVPLTEETLDFSSGPAVLNAGLSSLKLNTNLI